jgi:hypothetical protein
MSAEFEAKLRSWGTAACEAWGYAPPSAAWLSAVLARIPEGLQRGIAHAVQAGVVIPVAGYRFQLAGLSGGKGPYAFFSRDQERREALPNWEYLLQVVEYARWYHLLAGSGLILGFEDKLMDLTIRDRSSLLWCAEVKETGASADALVRGLGLHAPGIDLHADDRGNEPLRAAKRLIEHRPQRLSVLGIGRRHDYRVDFSHDGSFELVPDVLPWS